MQIKLVDERNKPLDEIECDLDSIITKAEQMEGDLFLHSVSLLEKHVGYVLTDSSKRDVTKYVRHFIVMGDSTKPLVIKVKKDKRKEGDEIVNVDTATLSFEEVVTFPNKGYEDRFQRLVGLDELKMHINKEAILMLYPEQLKKWSLEHYGKEISALRSFKDRYPFMIFEGDVGTGKTEFAETFGAAVAASMRKKVSLARMSMKSRGNGVVGEMSKLISKAFHDAKAIADSTKAPVILLLDEADSLAQSREETQMHHEDRAGVNALIQGIDHVRGGENPVLVIFCTNRSEAIDPAIKRRAAIIHTFTRPNLQQRLHLFENQFSDLHLKHEQLLELAKDSGETKDRGYGFTYSDIITRVVPQAVFAAFPDSKLTFETIKSVLLQLNPTPPFKEG